MTTLKEIQSDLRAKDLGSFLALELISEITIIRKEKGITQQRLSELSGVAQKTISRLENGKELITLNTASKLLNSLGCTAKIIVEPKQAQ